MPLFSLFSATQSLGQRAAGASTTAAAPVRTMPQYKYAAGVRNPQQHMASQPQVAMQQVRCKHLFFSRINGFLYTNIQSLPHSASCSCPRSGTPDCIHAGICPSSGTEADAGSVGDGLKLNLGGNKT